MDDRDLRHIYVSDLRRAPAVLAAIRRAASRDDRTVRLSFGRFADEPFLLYACCGLAAMEGVTVVMRPDISAPRR